MPQLSLRLDHLDRALIERAGAAGPALVAYSGGGDSTALLHAVTELLGARSTHACIVDHGRRAGSALEAAASAAYARALGVEPRIVRLAWNEGARPGQAALRRARYAALCEAARVVGANSILTGHTADDQAETVLLRAGDASGWRGLAAMRPEAPAPLWPEGRNLSLARPLLGARRAAIRVALRQIDAVWSDDPSNENADFARVRVRARLAAFEAAGLDPARLTELAAKLQARAAALDAAAWARIAGQARFDGPTINWPLAAAAGGAGQRALGVLIAAAGASEAIPDEPALTTLAARLEREGAATLSGALLRLKGAILTIARDPGALLGRADGAPPLAPMHLAPDTPAIWDGRAALCAASSGWIAEPSPSGAPVLSGGAGTVTIDWLIQARVLHLLALTKT